MRGGRRQGEIKKKKEEREKERERIGLSKNRIVPESFTTMQHHAARGTCEPLSVKGYIGYKMK